MAKFVVKEELLVIESTEETDNVDEEQTDSELPVMNPKKRQKREGELPQELQQLLNPTQSSSQDALPKIEVSSPQVAQGGSGGGSTVESITTLLARTSPDISPSSSTKTTSRVTPPLGRLIKLTPMAVPASTASNKKSPVDTPRECRRNTTKLSPIQKRKAAGKNVDPSKKL